MPSNLATAHTKPCAVGSRRGTLPAVKIGGRVKVLRSDPDALAVPTQLSHTFETIESTVARIAAIAPPLTDEQVRKLPALLGGGSL